jgi:type IX secretion system PorP/SprF family membrane protein
MANLNNTKKYGLVFALVILSFSSMGQIDPQMSQTWMRRLVFNPAAIQKTSDINIYGSARQQWTDFENSPSSQIIAATTYFEKYRLGLGVSIINDKAGVSSFQNIKLNYAYNFWATKDINITFGAGMGFIAHQIQTENLVFETPYDPYGSGIHDRKSQSDFDLGFEINMDNFTAGISCLHFVKSTKNATNFSVPRHYFFYTSYFYELNDKIILQPGFSMRKSANVFLWGISGMANFDNFISAGFDYRINDALAIVTRVAVTPYISIGYSYDFDMGTMKSYNSGSHEISVQAKISRGNQILKSPRFFD